MPWSTILVLSSMVSVGIAETFSFPTLTSILASTTTPSTLTSDTLPTNSLAATASFATASSSLPVTWLYADYTYLMFLSNTECLSSCPDVGANYDPCLQIYTMQYDSITSALASSTTALAALLTEAPDLTHSALNAATAALNTAHFSLASCLCHKSALAPWRDNTITVTTASIPTMVGTGVCDSGTYGACATPSGADFLNLAGAQREYVSMCNFYNSNVGVWASATVVAASAVNTASGFLATAEVETGEATTAISILLNESDKTVEETLFTKQALSTSGAEIDSKFQAFETSAQVATTESESLMTTWMTGTAKMWTADLKSTLALPMASPATAAFEAVAVNSDAKTGPKWWSSTVLSIAVMTADSSTSTKVENAWAWATKTALPVSSEGSALLRGGNSIRDTMILGLKLMLVCFMGVWLAG